MFFFRGGIVRGDVFGHGRCRRRGHCRGRRGDARRVGLRLRRLGARLGAFGARVRGSRLGNARSSRLCHSRQRLFQHSFPFPLDFRAVMRGGRRGLTAVTRRAVHVVSRANGHRAIQEPRVGFRALVRVYFRTVDRW